MKAFTVRQTGAKVVLYTSFLASMLIFCHPVKGLDTISSIKGTQPKTHRGAAHRLRTALRLVKPHKMAVTHHVLQHKMVVAHHILHAPPSHQLVLSSSTQDNKAVPFVKPAEVETLATADQPFVAGQNLILNGDFERGNTDFTSDYSYSSSNVSSDATYAVVSNPLSAHGGAYPMHDHTTTSGMMMVVNGSRRHGAILWKETVKVTPQVRYSLQAWSANWGRGWGGAAYPSLLEYFVNGTLVGTLTTSSTQDGLWQQFSANWDSGLDRTADIVIVALATGVGIGNNFTLDDISFKAIAKSETVERLPPVHFGEPFPSQFPVEMPIGSGKESNPGTMNVPPDSFSNTAQPEQKWEVVANSARLVLQDGVVSLKDNTTDFHVWAGQTPHFPLLRLKKNPFPTSGNWVLSFSYSYNSAGSNTNSDGVMVAREDNSNLLYLQQNGDGQALILDGKIVWSMKSNFDKHIVSLAKSGSRVTAFIDGNAVGQDNLGLPPITVKLGGDLSQTQNNWNNFELQSISVVAD